jgi:prevent-host-death family protein
MGKSELMIKSVTIVEAQEQFEKLLREAAAGETHVAIEENGQPIAGIISASELEILSRLGSGWWQRFEPLLRSWAAFSDEPPERIEQEIERAVAAVRRRHPLPRRA